MGSLGNRREREVQEEEEAMEMGPERSRPLHNFKMPRLKWGNQKFLRCMNEIPKGGSGNLSAAADRRGSVLGVEKGLIGGRREAEHVRRGRIERIVRTESFMKSPAVAAAGVGGKSQAEGYGIEAVRAKLLFDLQAAADKMKDAILREGLEEEEPMPPPLPAGAPVPAETDDAVRPWNLRTRRAACKAPNGMNGVIGSGGSGSGGGSGGGTVNGGVVRKPNFSPVRNGSKSPPNFPAAAEEKRERSTFSVPLSRREIEEDFRQMTGQRPPRRPKKRPKIVQKQLDTLFPGLWLTEVTADMYKVPDAPETGKR